MGNRKALIAGNWKMYKTADEAGESARRLVELVGTAARADVVIAPPFTALERVREALAGSKVALGAQNVFWEKEGAFTGEVSAEMLRAAGCSHVIVGHSERRQHFGETDAAVARRIKAALGAALIPIFCVGETLDQRAVNDQDRVVSAQLDGGYAAVSTEEILTTVIAYEPVWAIGTGQTATPEIAQRMHRAIRDWLVRRVGPTQADKIRILYGGSVKPDNISSLMNEADIDGALVGGASLNARSFGAIVNSV
ncbi:MAG: triose-phosphate isomerase [Acidobacteriota bacterium]